MSSESVAIHLLEHEYLGLFVRIAELLEDQARGGKVVLTDQNPQMVPLLFLFVGNMLLC